MWVAFLVVVSWTVAIAPATRLAVKIKTEERILKIGLCEKLIDEYEKNDRERITEIKSRRCCEKYGKSWSEVFECRCKY